MPKNVLIFDTRHVSPAVEVSFTIAQDHIDQGDFVQIVNISQHMPHGFTHGFGLSSTLIAYNKISNVIRYRPKHIPFHTDPLTKPSNIHLPFFKDIEELSEFQIDGIDFGMALASFLVLRYGLYTIKIDQHLKELNVMFQSSMFALESFKIWNAKVKPDLVYIRPGRIADNRPILRYCKMNQIPIKVVDFGHDPNYFGVADTYFADRQCWNNYVLDTWDSSNHDYNKKTAIAHQFFERKKLGKEKYFNYVQIQQKDFLPFNWNPEKRNMVYYTKTITESVFVDANNSPHTLFKNQLEAIDTIAEIASSIPDVDFYVREHPNTYFRFNAESETFNTFRNDPRLTFIDGNSPVSTYALLDNASIVLTYMSTVGIEAAYWGKPSIVVGNSYYHELGSVYAPKSIEELTNLLTAESLPDLPKLGAMKYGYHCEVFGKRIRNFVSTGRHSGLYQGVDLNKTSTPIRILLFILRWISFARNYIQLLLNKLVVQT